MKSFIVAFFEIIFGQKGLEWVHALRFVYLIKKRRYVESEMSLIPLFIMQGEVVVDAGANGANWTYDLSKAVGQEGKVYAFEVDPYYAKVTKQTIKMLSLKNVIFFEYGLSDVEETHYLNVYDSYGQRYRGLSHLTYNDDGIKSKKIEVSLKKLDDLIPKHPRLLETKLLKCDVEGYELHILQGAKNIIEKTNCIIILEIGYGHRYGYEVKDIFSFLSSRNYEGYVMSEKLMNKILTRKNTSRNVVFIPKTTESRHKLIKTNLKRIFAENI